MPFVRPAIPPFEEVQAPLREVFASRMVTTGPYAEQLGEKMREHLDCRHAVAVSSCTTGLVLALQAMQLPAGSEVIVPSFTFMATGTPLIWNRLRPVFADIDAHTINLDPKAVEAAITPRTSAIVGVHQFGNPAPIEALQDMADRNGLALAFDAAHGLGTRYRSKAVGGYGNFSAFSLSPTKLVIAGEGGIVSTDDASLAEQVRYARNYGNPGNYDCLYPGLNARMSELHALMALTSAKRLAQAVHNRNRMVSLYRQRLEQLPGIRFQQIDERDQCSYKDMCVVIDPEAFGLNRDQLIEALEAEGVMTKVYYQPILHQMTAFAAYAPEEMDARFPNSVYLAQNSVCLPLYSDMSEDEVDRVCSAVELIQAYAPQIRRRMTGKSAAS